MSMPANMPVIRRGLHSSKLAQFGLPIPPRVATFFDGPELAAYAQHRACGISGWTGDTKLKVRWGARRLAMIHEYANDGHFGEASAKYLPIAAVGSETYMFAVDTASDALAVHFFDYESGWSPYADSFDAFLGKLLPKGHKTPSERLEAAYDHAKELEGAKRHADVLAHLEPIVALFPSDPHPLDDTRDHLGAAYNLMGIAHEKLGDIPRARAAYEKGLALGCDAAGLNICDLYFNHEKDYAGLVAYAEERRRSIYKWADAYAYFHIRNYLGQGYLLTGRAPLAVRAYHQILENCSDDPPKIDEAISDLRELIAERPEVDRAAAEGILAWLVRPVPAPPSPQRAAELRRWWTALPAKVAEAVREELNLDEDAAPTDADLVRATQIDDLKVTHADLEDLGWLAMFERLDDLNLEGNKLVDLAPIARHVRLTRLDISENRVTSLRALAPLVRLKRLSCGENPLTDGLAGIEAMHALEYLHVNEAKLTSLEPLRGLPELAELTVYSNEITDLSPLATCPRLKEISAFSCPIATGVAALAALPKLERVEFGEAPPELEALRRAAPVCRVGSWGGEPEIEEPAADVAERRAWWNALPDVWRKRFASKLDDDDGPVPSDEALRGLVREDSLGFDDEPLPDLEPLRRFTHADYVNVANTGITDLAPVAGLPRMIDLLCRDNPIASLRPLAAAVMLEELYVERCGLTSLAGLEVVRTLRELWAEDNAIEDLGPLAELVELRELDFEGNRVASVAPLANLRRLRSLRLGQNRVIDIAPLAGCAALESLEIWANPGVRGAVALAGLVELRKIVSHGSLPRAEIDELRRKRPDIAID